MSDRWDVVRLVFVLAVVGGDHARAADGEPAEDRDAFVVRLVHPDRQAAEVLRLFQGARWSDPAAALAAWKQAGPPSGQLGKPVEAVIAFFNPEMIPEWRAMDGAEVRAGLDLATGGIGWLVVIPRDDGTLAAGITAMRLTYPEDRPIAVEGKEVPVARLGRSGVPFGCQDGAVVVVGSSRDRLVHGLGIAAAGRNGPRGAASPAIGTGGQDEARDGGEPAAPDSGMVFRLEPGRITTPRNATIGSARAIEAMRAMGCRRVDGTATLEDGTLQVDVTTTFDRPRPREEGPRPPTVDLDWLESLPSSGVMAMVSMAIDPGPTAWDRAFAVADRVERVDPDRARLAPLRARLNLLAAAAGLKLEADLRPHLRGLSACLIGDPARPGPPTGALVVLHLDDRSTARRIVRESSPRLGALLGARSNDPAAGADRPPVEPGNGASAEAPHHLGKLSGRPVTVRARGRDIWLAWGDGETAATTDDPPAPGRSLAAVCGGWVAEGRTAPGRVAAFWPGRISPPAGIRELPSDALRSLAADPPVVWWGWSRPDGEHDLIRWRGLRQRVRGFLQGLPPSPG